MTQWGLDNLFNPGKRHMDDEKRRLQSTREEVGDSSGGRRIDLDGGKVSIVLPSRRTDASTPALPDDGAQDLDGAQRDDPLAAAEDVDPASSDEQHLDEPSGGASTADSPIAPSSRPSAGSKPRRATSASAWSRRG